MAQPTTTASLTSITELDLTAKYTVRVSQAVADQVNQAAANAGQDAGAWLAGIVGPAVTQALAAQGVAVNGS